MLLAALDEMGRHPEIRRVRRTAMDAFRPEPGWQVLDAGSGAGEVARWIAGQVGPSGQVTALDYSAATIAAAVERHDGSNVSYTTGDVSAIDLPSGSVDGVWCERVLQHVDDADLAVAELVRVTRAGGRLCLIDTVWSSLGCYGVPPAMALPGVAAIDGRLTPKKEDMG